MRVKTSKVNHKRRIKKGPTVTFMRLQVKSLMEQTVVLRREAAVLSRTLGDSTDHLKQMCDLCDTQRAQIDTQRGEIDHLRPLIKILVGVIANMQSPG